MKRLVILISNAGSGSNLQAIIDAIKTGTLQATITAVISDRDDAKGLTHATKNGIKTRISPKKEALFALLTNEAPDYIVLSGWKQLITDDIIKTFPNKILNLHPGLIPETKDGTVTNPDGTTGLWNKGKYAKAAVAQFLETKATYAGSSVHMLSDDVDFGPVLGRSFEKTRPSDTIDSLYTRLKKKENQLYVEVLQKLCSIDSSS